MTPSLPPPATRGKAETIDLRGKASQLTEHWQPRVVAEMNDDQFKIVKLRGEFVWHQHDDTDETFLVLNGELKIELPDRALTLGPGQLAIVPRGMRHRPVAITEVTLLLIEPRGVTNTGNVGGPLTVPNDQWI